MREISIECAGCEGIIELPLPDAWKTGDGAVIPTNASSRAEDALDLVDYMRRQGCPSCGSHDMTLLDQA
jgi:hypothetical protein